jgi:hypothetical protein
MVTTCQNPGCDTVYTVGTKCPNCHPNGKWAKMAVAVALLLMATSCATKKEQEVVAYRNDPVLAYVDSIEAVEFKKMKAIQLHDLGELVVTNQTMYTPIEAIYLLADMRTGQRDSVMARCGACCWKNSDPKTFNKGELIKRLGGYSYEKVDSLLIYCR